MPEPAAIVVGGGPAGLFLAACLAAELGAFPGRGILLLEKGPRPGRKLLASGSGQCNITHSGPVEEFLGRYGDKGRFLKKALYGFTNSDLEAWFLDRGVPFEVEEGGKAFPSSRRAGEVLDALLRECRLAGVEILTNRRVASAERTEGGFALGFEPGSNTLRTQVLAIATGGMSYPGTGSEGEGYRLASALGHAIVPPRPALSPVSVRDFSLGTLAGLGFAGAAFVVRRGGKKVAESRGDILITHEGLSGPGILDASRGIRPGDLIEVDFSGLGAEAFRPALDERCAASPRSLVKSVLADTGLPRRMAELFCALAGLGEGATCAGLRRESRRALEVLACAFPAEVEALSGYEKAMATAGGVSLDEVDPATMESRVAPGLYFAGEVLDYDGDTGGYNLQAAFSTAAAAARAIAARLGYGEMAMGG
jgi:predicted Rossmann fold flavoprotein